MSDASALGIALNVIMLALYVLFWGAAFVVLYHLTRFGVGTQPKRFALVFFLGAAALFGASLLLFANLDVKTLLS